MKIFSLLILSILFSLSLAWADQSLDALLDRADRIQVFFSNRNEIAFESSTRSDFDELKKALIFDQNLQNQLLPNGNPDIILFKNSQPIATISYLPLIGIRCKELWPVDKKLTNPQLLIAWFENRRVIGPRELYVQTYLAEEEGIKNRDEWFAQLPVCLQVYEKKIKEECAKSGYSPNDLNMIMATWTKCFPKKNEQIFELFAWYGKDRHSWIGMPIYAFLPELLLNQYHLETINSTITYAVNMHIPMTDEQKMGIARYYSNWDLKTSQVRDSSNIPRHFKNELVAFIRKSAEPMIIKRVERALLE